MTGTVKTGDQGPVVQPQSSLTLTLNCVVVVILLNNTGFTLPQPHWLEVVIFCQEFELLNWNLYLKTGIDVFAKIWISSPKHAGFGIALRTAVGIGLTLIFIYISIL